LFKQVDAYLAQPSTDQRKKVEEAYEQFDRTVKPANADFISMVVERYRDMLNG
jgi:hypothetical protein